MKSTVLTFISTGAIVSMCCAFHLVSFKAKPGRGEKNSVTFYKVPLVCSAAPEIGCGSKAKPVLKLLEKNSNVAGAMLNHAGTVIAVVWKDNVSTNAAEDDVMEIFKEQNMDVEKVGGKEYETLAKDFDRKENWLRHTEVDQLSMIEAGEIATRLVARVNAKTSLSKEVISLLKTDIENYFKKLFVGLNTDNINKDPDLLKSFREKTRGDLSQIGKKYLNSDQLSALMVAIESGFQPVEGEPGYESDGCCSKPKDVSSKSGTEKNEKKSCCSKSSSN